MLEKVGPATYHIELHPSLKIHPIFHVSQLKAFHGDHENLDKQKSSQAPLTTTNSSDNNASKEILDNKISQCKRVLLRHQFLIWWAIMLDSDISWEYEEDLLQFLKAIKDYLTMTRLSQV